MDSETPTLSDLIQESMEAVDPETDNLQAPVEDEDQGQDTDEASILDMIGDEDEDDESEDEELSDDEEDEDPTLGETYKVKVDGEVVEVTLKEALAGYQRQADYTRKAQALAAEKQQLEEVISEVGGTLQTIKTLDDAWSENPISVLTHFLSNTENPTHSMALLIKEAATANLLEQEFLDMFGITSEMKRSWSKETEVDTLRRKVSRSEQEEMSRKEAALYEQAVNEAMAEYAREIDGIVAEEGLQLNRAQRDAFQTRLAKYAYENDLTNLTAAYKALKYEETKRKREVAKKTKERVQQKKAASVVGRSTSGGQGTPVSDSTDLESLVRAALKEQGVA